MRVHARARGSRPRLVSRYTGALSAPHEADPPLRIPLLSGDGFAEALFLTSLWFAAAAIALASLPLLITGHWILAIVCLLVGLFFVGAWWVFPGQALAQRPADLCVDRSGLRVVGGATHGLQLAWDQIDAERSGLGNDREPGMERLLVATRDGGEVMLARGDERQSFIAVIDLLRAAAGLEPLPANSQRRAAGDGKRRRKRGKKAREAATEAGEAAPEPEPVTVDVIACPGCGAPVVPADAASVACHRCGRDVALPELLRTRLREASHRAALAAANTRRLRRLLAQPSSAWTSAFVTVFAGFPLLLWLFAWLGFSILLWRGSLDGPRMLGLVAPPLLLGIALPIFAGLYTCRRRTVRLLTLDFAAAPPAHAGDPPRCRVCGAPLACAPGALLAGCAYCGARNIIAVTLPRSRARDQQQASSIEDAIGGFEAELIFRGLGFLLFGVPGIWLAWAAVRELLLA